MTFTEFTRRAVGDPELTPYPYQERLANDGLPDLVLTPTGAGKTMGAVLGWLYRRREHPDQAVRRDTPRWLVFVLPRRSLVEQTAKVIDTWLANLGAPVRRFLLTAGVDAEEREWMCHPAREAIFVGTQDIVLSRLLMRGYAEPRARWPVSFGLLHAGVQFVFDEAQLLGPGLTTSLRLRTLRERLGAAQPCRTTWMSASLEPARLAPGLGREPRVVELEDDDRNGPLRTVLEATRLIRRIEVAPERYATSLAERVLAEHQPGTRTLVVLNTVDRAQDTFDAIMRSSPRARVVLLHSLFRPGDRARQTEAATADPPEEGLVVVGTQVVEAGLDLTSDTLFTELAPWSSIVRRAGRCNRDGRAPQARILWTTPPPARGRALPYEPDELAHSAAILDAMNDQRVSGGRLRQAGHDLDQRMHPGLGRRDLLGLFDTSADLLGGNDVDITPWIENAGGRNVWLAWRPREQLVEDAPSPTRDELCPAPIDRLTDELVTNHGGLHSGEEGWRPADGSHLRPGAVFLLDADAGGYLPERGFDPTSRAPVQPTRVVKPRLRADALQDDPGSVTGHWVDLATHLDDTDQEARALLAELNPSGISAEQRRAAVLGARYHDVGKAHPTFDASLRRAAWTTPPHDGPWAKSDSNRPLRHDPPHFRHELASALLLLHPSTGLLDEVTEPDLVTYLALAHHGAVRVTVHGHPDERQGRLLGVTDGDTTLPARLPDGRLLPPCELSLEPTKTGRSSLTARALRLRDRADLGPFRLAFLEAVVRIADWRSSANRSGATATPSIPI